MAHPSKRKGSGFELEVVKRLQEAGIAAEKVPLSGAVKGGSFEADIDCPVRGVDRKLECKRRARQFTTISSWLEPGIFAVVMRDNRSPTLVCMRLEDFAELAK